MGVWVNWGLVVGAIALIVCDLVLEVYETVNLAALGMFLLAGGILGLAIDSAAVGLADCDSIGACVPGSPSPPGTHAAETCFRALGSFGKTPELRTVEILSQIHAPYIFA